MNKETFQMVAKTLQGLEEILAGELIALGANNVEIGRRMVSFEGDTEMLYKANFYCRTALRILKPIYTFRAKNADEVYTQVKSVDWDKYMDVDKTFAIDSVIFSEDFNHSKFVAYRTKDAIADYFMDKYTKRPSVRVSNPDLYINIHISHNSCTLSIDSSGESLHKRGYRVDQTDAPLNEVLAAGMIMKTGWKGDSNFVDPMCGSGTMLIEATMIALNIAPGIHRKEFAFEKWVDFDQDLFDRIYNDDSNEREFEFKAYGSDVSPVAIEIARKNIRSAGLSKYINLDVKPLQQYSDAPLPGIMITNPPYGERISSKDLLGLYEMIGERMKHAFMGYNVWIISYQEECFEKIGLRPSEKHKLINGSLECEYRRYEIFEGKREDYKKALSESGEAAPVRPGSGLRSNREGNSQLFGDRERKSFGDRKPFGDRDRKPYEGGERKSYGDRKPFEGGERKSYGDRDRKPYEGGERKSYGDRKPFEGGERKSYGDRDRKPYEGGERKSFGDRKPYSGKLDDRGNKPFMERKAYNEGRPEFGVKQDTPSRRFSAVHGEAAVPTSEQPVSDKKMIDLSARKTFNIERAERTSRPRIGGGSSSEKETNNAND